MVLAFTQSLVEEVHNPSSSAHHESIAIIGAGISGGLFAFELQAQAQSSTSRDVTIFERDTSVGGRIRSVSLPQIVRATAEAGSPAFYVEDWCINQAIKKVGLEIVQPNPLLLPRKTGIWNGSHFWQSSTCAAKAPSWRDILKYGLSPWRWRKVARRVLDNWDSFASTETVNNITRELERHRLQQLVEQPATEYLHGAGISKKYSSDLIDTCTRKRFLQALPTVHSFAALMAAQDNPTGPIRGGNSRLVEDLLQESKSQLHLDTAVLRIGLGQSHRYRVTYSKRTSSEDASPPSGLVKSQEFDKVIIATPLRTANIDLGDLSNFSTAAMIPYSDVHVTLLLTPAKLSPSFFNLPDSTVMTDDVMVTAHASDPIGLYSISESQECWIDDRFCHFVGPLCDQVVCENLYRIVSGTQIEDIDIVRMIGGQFRNDTPLLEQGISWVHRQPWPSSIPAHRPIANHLQELEIAPGLFYLGGAEEVISSMEMSCRIAKSVARRVSYGQ